MPKYFCPECNVGKITVTFTGQPDDCDVYLDQTCGCDLTMMQGEAIIERALDEYEPDADFIYDALKDHLFV